jgi:hypothetical protein
MKRPQLDLDPYEDLQNHNQDRKQQKREKKRKQQKSVIQRKRLDRKPRNK